MPDEEGEETTKPDHPKTETIIFCDEMIKLLAKEGAQLAWLTHCIATPRAVFLFQLI